MTPTSAYVSNYHPVILETSLLLKSRADPKTPPVTVLPYHKPYPSTPPHYYSVFHGVKPSGNCYNIEFLVYIGQLSEVMIQVSGVDGL